MNRPKALSVVQDLVESPTTTEINHAPILEKLTGFLAAFAPAVGEQRPAYDGADVEASFEIHVSRDLAIVAAFQAVERIARSVCR